MNHAALNTIDISVNKHHAPPIYIHNSCIHGSFFLNKRKNLSKTSSTNNIANIFPSEISEKIIENLRKLVTQRANR